MALLKIFIKLVLIFVFIGCLYPMPYNYYQMVRLISFTGFAVLGYLDYKDGQYFLIVPSAIGVLLFNPLFKITFKREIWQDIDVAIAYILAAWILIEGFYLLYHTIRKKESKKVRELD
jgi:hypothetical protein